MSLYRGLRLALSQVYRQPDSAYSSTQRGDLKWRTKDENVRILTAACCVFAQLCTIRVYLCRGRPWDMLMVVYGFCNKVCCCLGSVRPCPTFIGLHAEPLDVCRSMLYNSNGHCSILPSPWQPKRFVLRSRRSGCVEPKHMCATTNKFIVPCPMSHPQQ